MTTDARSALSKATSIFVLFATTHAQRVAGIDQRDNITAQDVVEAMHHMDFDSFAPPLKDVYQQNKRIRDQKNERRRENRKSKKNSLLAAGPSGSQMPVHGSGDHDDDDEQDDYEEDDQASEQTANNETGSFNPSDVQFVTLDDNSSD